jgi:flagellin
MSEKVSNGASSKDSSIGAALQHFLGTSEYSNINTANDEFVQHYTDNALSFHNDSTHSFQITLGDLDTGAIGGANADGGGIISHKDAVPDSGTGYDPVLNPSTNPLDMFGLKWEKEGISMTTPNEEGKEVVFQFTNSITIDDKNSYNLRNASSAQLTLNLLENWLGELNDQTSTVSTNLHSLNVSIEKLQNSLANYTSAVSRISDTDYASETTNFVKNQIRAESSVSILSKGNENKISIGQLLEGVKIAKSNS